MSGQRPDLNAMLANLEREFTLRARLHRESAAEHQRVIDGFQGELYADAQRPIIERELRAAQAWDLRAAEARGGYFLARQADISDAEFMQEYSDIFSLFQEQGRVVYRASVQDQQIQQNVGGDSHNPSVKSSG